MYDNTAETDVMLRDVNVEAVSRNLKALLDHSKFVDLLKTQGGLATEILRKATSESEPRMQPHQTNDALDEWSGRSKPTKK